MTCIIFREVHLLEILYMSFDSARKQSENQTVIFSYLDSDSFLRCLFGKIYGRQSLFYAHYFEKDGAASWENQSECDVRKGPTQTELYKDRGWLEARNFVIKSILEELY